MCITFSQSNKNAWIYSAAVFTVVKTGGKKDRNTADRERIYAAAKAFGLNY